MQVVVQQWEQVQFSMKVQSEINGESGTEMEIIGVDNVMPQVLWTEHFMEAQGHSLSAMIFQDNKIVMLLEMWPNKWSIEQ